MLDKYIKEQEISAVKELGEVIGYENLIDIASRLRDMKSIVDEAERIETKREPIKLSEELKRCLDGDSCKNCERFEINSVLTCRGLLQAAYEQVKRNEEREEIRIMERITNCRCNLTKCEKCVETSSCYSHGCNHILEAISKLKHYEDLEEQRKLLKLPCAVGDTVYRINASAKNPIISMKVCEIGIISSKTEGFITEFSCCDKIDGGETHYFSCDIGKIVFLAQEQAEAALQALKETEGENE